MKKKKSKRLFTTEEVDDSYFMCSELHVSKGIEKGALEFHIDGQKDNTFFTVYKQGVIDLHEFLTKWINEKNI